ncbi:MAG: N-acetyltransferase [Defluviitaleaceae bacterium]|nr:N-acetyltransferase [Defluviitaleaceae bacterium]
MHIRQETPADYDEVYRLVKISFESNESTDGTVPDYLNELRKSDVFIPELSLVAEKDGTIIGQIVLYKTDITTPQGNRTELLLSPISIHPNYFKQGIARAMTEEALSRAKSMGYSAVFLCGNPDFYRKLGFAPSYQYNIFHKSDASAKWSMVRELYDGALNGISGNIDTV